MAQLRILKWHAALFGIVEPEEIQTLFSLALKRMPMTHEELAQRLGVSQPTVSRWTSGASTPALSEMRRTIQVIADEVALLHVFVSKLNEILQRVERLDALLLNRDADAAPARKKAQRELLGLLGEVK